MKLSSIPLTMLALQVALVGCGNHEKNPVKDLSQLRDQGKTEIAKESAGPVILPGKTIIVKQEVPVYKESASISDNSISIYPVIDMNFTEGIASTFQIIGISSVPGVEIKVSAVNLPEGAVFKADSTQKDRYNLTYTPAFDSVSADQITKKLDLKLRADVVSAPSESIKNALQNVNREKVLSLNISKNTNPPTDLKVTNLPDVVGEDQLVSFQVTVQVPGVTPQSAPKDKPVLLVFSDTSKTVTVNNLIEREGSRHVIIDQNKKDPEYVGNFNWKFNLVFDTKNISVQSPLNKAGEIEATAGEAPVRIHFKAYKLSSSTPELTKSVRIALNKPVTAPRFNLLALGQESLEVKAGQKVQLKFSVESADAKSSLKLELPNLKAISGSPKITCAAALKSSVQNCTLTWNIPCQINEADLNQEITMAAIAISGGRSSEIVKQTLKVTKSVDQSVLEACVAKPKAATAAPKAATKKVVASKGAKK